MIITQLGKNHLENQAYLPRPHFFIHDKLALLFLNAPGATKITNFWHHFFIQAYIGRFKI